MRTVCRECTVGCGLVAGVEGGRVVDIQGDEDHPVSRGRLCARGTAFVQGLTLPERLTVPTARKKRGGSAEPLDDWKSGLDLLAERLRQVRERHGPDSLLIGCDLEGGLDFTLGALRFARLFGTSRVFEAAGRPVDPWPDGLHRPAAPCTEWIHGRCLFLVEADLAVTHPVAFAWVQEAQRRGAQVVAADARFTATLAKADHALRMKPGRGNLLGLALAKLMMAEGGIDARAVEAGVADGAGWRASLEQMSLEGADDALGVPLGDLQRLARLLLGNGPVTVVTGRPLANLPHHRIWLTLAVAAGWSGRPGGGWYPVEAGIPPLAVHDDAGTGSSAAEGRKPATPPALPEAEEGGPRAAICSGNSLSDYLSPFGRLPEQLELVVHFGAFPNATWERASMAFPAALWAERDGVVFGDDRSIQWGGKIVDSPAGCRSGLEFWTELARRFGWEAHSPWATEDGRADHGAFYAWLLGRSPFTAGVSLDRLRDLEPGSRLFWPVAEGAPPDEIAPHRAPASLVSAPETADPDHPLSLLAAQSSCRSGDASRFWPWTRSLVREDVVQIHPETARLLGIENGDEVIIDTPRGKLPARASLSRAVPMRSIASFHGVNGLPASVRRRDQAPDESRDLLKKPAP